ncbi:MAG: Gamma-glutamyltranspeptidase precursor [Pseudomonadota bacterium]
MPTLSWPIHSAKALQAPMRQCFQCRPGVWRLTWRWASRLALALGLLQPPGGWTQTMAPAPEAASARLERTPVGFDRRGVVSAHPEATRAGWQVLRRGGNAVDAAIATQFALAVVEPQSSGLGGGGFAVSFDGRAVSAWDGRETAPAAATSDLFKVGGQAMDFAAARRSPLSVGVPGLVPLLQAMHRREGDRPWAELLDPAIRLAEQGFAITPRLHGLLQSDPLLRDDPQARHLYYTAQGDAQPVGHVLRNPELGWVLRQIAAHGARAMQDGAVAQALLRRINAGEPGGSPMSAADLSADRVRVHPALCFAWAGLPQSRLCGAPPPTSGTVALGQMLNLIEMAPTRARTLPRGAPWWHTYIESARLAFADRAAYIGDPASVGAPSGGWEVLWAPKYLQARAQQMGNRRMPVAEPGQPEAVNTSFGQMPDQAEYGTTHLSVVDGQGRAVVLTSSLESAFGARRMVNTGQGRAGGFLLNHQLTDFALNPSDETGRPLANAPGAGKRPRSSMSPLLVLSRDAAADGPARERVSMLLGSAGGPFIIHHVAQALWAMAHWGLGPQAAVSLGHVGLTAPQGVVWLEKGTEAVDFESELSALGHPVRLGEISSGLHVLMRDATGRWQAGVDPRREGMALGD